MNQKKAKEKGLTIVGLEGIFDAFVSEKSNLKKEADELISDLREDDEISPLSFVNTTFANSSSPGFSSFPVHQSIRKGYPDRIKGKLSFQIHTFPFRLIRFLYLLISRIVC